VHRSDERVWHAIALPAELVGASLTNLAVDGLGRAWVASFDLGVGRRDRDGTWHIYTRDDVLPTNTIVRLVSDGRGGILASGIGGAVHWRVPGTVAP
jgi:hypothetical protein